MKLILIGPESNGLYSIDVNAKLGNGIPESDTLWIKAYDQASCHKIDIDKTQYSVNYQTQNIIVKLTDKGIVGGKYIATWNGSRILGLDDTELDMNVSEPEKIIFNVNSKNMSEGYYTGKHHKEYRQQRSICRGYDCTIEGQEHTCKIIRVPCIRRRMQAIQYVRAACDIACDIIDNIIPHQGSEVSIQV